ncbi:Cobalamin import system permease protein BtuC [Candidatus Lokiarchaeum ossiferum]|uniref:Cobalamin import system permease protein BtuC n=1 Tax=Candidatus Lokiarchaeum ossiferum TaxID=2951803 RepID=A0ABY6I1Z4_9ARCH|nr:Cobalamin import system permease protein BtuC [Candidatus Lokiarchaeum sp. B-35]
MKKSMQIITLQVLIFLLIFSVFMSCTLGSVKIPLSHSIAILLNEIGIQTGQSFTQVEQVIILQLRLPRILMAVIVGAMLSMAGVISQIVFRNPIADPYVIGISSAAGFGAALVIVFELFFFRQFTIPLFSFIFAIGAVFLIYMIARSKSSIHIYSLLLSGIALSYIFSALISFILFLSEDKSHMILSILLGKLWGITWVEVKIAGLLLIPFTTILIFYGLDMNLLLMGDSSAQTMGVNVKRSKSIVLLCMTMFTATAVAFCGSIGFIGLIVPHITRLIFGSDNRKIIPISGIVGAILLIWADVLARILISPQEIPVGVFTSLMGGPFFIYLVIKKKRSNK